EEVRVLLTELKKNPWTKESKDLDDPVLHDIVMVSLLTGARAGEVFSIRGRDVNLDEGFVSFIDTKNGTSRHVPIPDTLQKILRDRMPANPSDYIFQSKKGGKIREVSHAFDRAVERLGFNEGASSRDRVTFHTLRHTFCSWAVLSGTPLRTVMDLSGHKSLAMLQRYAHLSGEDRRRATSAVEDMFKSTGDKVVSISTGKEEK
ncbi:MAG TPA: site-specific integrase, partial [Syntrophales bacterium]|nr:site-specific integrase [Syntrophales bacterium]